MADLDHYLRKGAAMLRGEAAEVTMNDVVGLMQLTQPHLFVDTSFGRTVYWPDGSASKVAPPTQGNRLRLTGRLT